MIGGVPAGGLNFGAATNAQAIIDQPYQFDFYDGGGLDVAFLGLAQADSTATSTSANSARGLPAPAASSTSARMPRRWCSSARSRRAAADRRRGRPAADRQGGQRRKFVREVEHRTFSGEYALKRGQPVLYVTERCVFKLTRRGWS